MKHFTPLLAMLLSLVFYIPATAQIDITDFGARLGTNLAWQSYDNSSNYKAKPCLDLAGLVRVDFCENFFGQGELHFIGKGGQEEYENFGMNIDQSIRLSYLEIQLPVFYRVPIESDVIKPHVGLGPYFGYGVSGKYKYNDEEDTEVFDDWHKRGDFGFTIVISVDFTVADLPFFADIRYNLGLSNIIEYENETVRNRGIGIGVGILFVRD